MMTTIDNDMYNGLPVLRTKDAIVKAKTVIEEERSGEQYGLYCRWNSMNRAMSKYWRFSQSNLIGGRSGSGKSMFINLLRSDFLDFNDTYFPSDLSIYLGDKTLAINTNDGVFYPEANIMILNDGTYVRRGINRGCVYNVVIIHFGFEMNPHDELLRSASNIVGCSYDYIISAEYDKEKYNGYNKLTDSEKLNVDSVLDSMGQRKEYYVEHAGNIKQMEETIDWAVSENPDSKIVISVDHTLLTRKLDEKGQGELITNLAFAAVRWRKTYEAMVIFAHQLNNQIESDDRILKPNFHYPTKKDLHYGSEIWWASDNVMIIHRPKSLGITSYSPKKLVTNHLIHLPMLKKRSGRVASVWFREDFAHSRIHSAERKDFILASP